MLHSFSSILIIEAPEDDCTHMYLKMSQFSSIQGILRIHFLPLVSQASLNFGSNLRLSSISLGVGFVNWNDWMMRNRDDGFYHQLERYNWFYNISKIFDQFCPVFELNGGLLNRGLMMMIIWCEHTISLNSVSSGAAASKPQAMSDLPKRFDCAMIKVFIFSLFLPCWEEPCPGCLFCSLLKLGIHLIRIGT